MFALRLVVLLFVTMYGWGMGQYSDLNGFGKFVAFSFFLAAPMLYMLPTIEAVLRKRTNIAAIAVVNIFLGWSLVGWVVALAWALKSTVQAVEVASVASNVVPSPQADTPVKGERTCPFCAETIKLAAVKCKHCGSDLTKHELPAQ